MEGVFREIEIFKCEIQFVPPLGGAFQPRDGIGDFDFVMIEIIWARSEYELALGKEST